MGSVLGRGIKGYIRVGPVGERVLAFGNEGRGGGRRLARAGRDPWRGVQLARALFVSLSLCVMTSLMMTSLSVNNVLDDILDTIYKDLGTTAVIQSTNIPQRGSY